MANLMSMPGPCVGSRTAWAATPMHAAPNPRLAPCHRPTWECRSQAGSSQGPSQPEDDKPAVAAREEATAQAAAVLPKSGYFSLADPNQEIYSKAGERFDPEKKGGRWKPEFIWNTNWQEALKMQESLERRRDVAQEAARAAQQPGARLVPKGNQTGAVGLSRLADLDRMDVDLSEMLKRKAEDKAKAAVKAPAPAPAPKAAQQVPRDSLQAGAGRLRGPQLAASRSIPLPRNDLKRLERANRITRQMMVTTVTSSKPQDTAAMAEAAAAELVRYEQEKLEQRAWSAAFSVVGAVSTYAAYGREVCISYCLGALAGYVYLRLLSRSVDGYGAQAMASAVGNQRLLIPIILALGYNRWNTLYADEYGVQLSLLAMLVGFFTYKLALVTRQGKQVLDEISVQRKGSSDSAS